MRAGELEAQLAKKLLAAYVIHGDEPLLAQEAADAVRAAARRAGFAERSVLEPGRGFDWSEFSHAADSLSLFAEKKLVELRLPTGKPGTQGAATIAAYAERASEDVLLLVSVPRVDRSTQSSPWFSALAKLGAIVDVWPVERARLPAWIAERLGRQKQRAPREVLEFLAERVEGNLIAAHQELQKLALLAPEGELGLDTVRDAVASVARYDADDAAEALLSGELERYARVVDGLRAEGEAVPFVMFVLSGALFGLQAQQRGTPAPRYFNQTLQRAIAAGAARYSARVVDRALIDCAAIDRDSKGVGKDDPWQALLRLGLRLAGGAKG
jgi:DNA polymerase-3 subunit delta